MIACGVVAAVVGFLRGPRDGLVPLLTGIALCALAVVELLVREHFSGYRSHALLLAFLPVVALQSAVGLGFSDVTLARLALAPEAAVFVALFVLLRRRFHSARRMASPGTPSRESKTSP